MEDMINRGEVLEIIDEFNLENRFAAYSDYSEMHDIISELPSANGWISCKERLPEPETMVIVACYGSDIIIPEEGETVGECCARLQRECVRVTLGFIGSDGWYDSEWSPMIISPKYWQPLPEPPESGNDYA